MKLKVKPFPAVMTVLSALYLIYVRSSEDTVLKADAVGGDPGGKLLPTIIALFMLIGFLYITLRERPEGEKMEKGTLVLFLLTLGLSIAYTALLKPVGFVLMTTLVLYVLEYAYTTIGEQRNVKDAVLGGVGTLVITGGCYMLMRYLTKMFLRLAREGSLPSVFGSTVFNGFLSILLVVALTVVFGLTVCKLLKKKGKNKVADAGLITFATVLLLYVVFKQFFSVNLAVGLLNY